MPKGWSVEVLSSVIGLGAISPIGHFLIALGECFLISFLVGHYFKKILILIFATYFSLAISFFLWRIGRISKSSGHTVPYFNFFPFVSAELRTNLSHKK